MKKWKQLAFIFMLTLSLVTFSACGIGKNDADKQDSTKQETTIPMIKRKRRKKKRRLTTGKRRKRMTRHRQTA